MALDKNDVVSIAKLAKLDVDPSQIEDVASELSSILDFVDQMNQIDTKNINPVAHPLDLTARTREDIVKETNQREHFQTVAPLVKDGLYLVPKVID